MAYFIHQILNGTKVSHHLISATPLLNLNQAKYMGVGNGTRKCSEYSIRRTCAQREVYK
jgi:hypothetical protein